MMSWTSIGLSLWLEPLGAVGRAAPPLHRAHGVNC
jgi:hypothetical protein